MLMESPFSQPRTDLDSGGPWDREQWWPRKGLEKQGWALKRVAPQLRCSPKSMQTIDNHITHWCWHTRIPSLSHTTHTRTYIHTGCTHEGYACTDLIYKHGIPLNGRHEGGLTWVYNFKVPCVMKGLLPYGRFDTAGWETKHTTWVHDTPNDYKNGHKQDIILDTLQ